MRSVWLAKTTVWTNVCYKSWRCHSLVRRGAYVQPCKMDHKLTTTRDIYMTPSNIMRQSWNGCHHRRLVPKFASSQPWILGSRITGIAVSHKVIEQFFCIQAESSKVLPVEQLSLPVSNASHVLCRTRHVLGVEQGLCSQYFHDLKRNNTAINMGIAAGSCPTVPLRTSTLAIT